MGSPRRSARSHRSEARAGRRTSPGRCRAGDDRRGERLAVGADLIVDVRLRIEHVLGRHSRQVPQVDQLVRTRSPGQRSPSGRSFMTCVVLPPRSANTVCARRDEGRRETAGPPQSVVRGHNQRDERLDGRGYESRRRHARSRLRRVLSAQALARRGSRRVDGRVRGAVRCRLRRLRPGGARPFPARRRSSAPAGRRGGRNRTDRLDGGAQRISARRESPPPLGSARLGPRAQAQPPLRRPSLPLAS